MNFSKSSITAIMLSLASATFANQITFVNGSSTSQDMNVIYKTISVDDGKTLIQNKVLNVSAGTAINLPLGNHTSVGVIPVSINGHLIPMDSDYRAEDSCAVMFDNNNSFAKLTLTYHEKTKNNKAYISCSKEIN